jgi:kelch-like protein 24/35
MIDFAEMLQIQFFYLFMDMPAAVETSSNGPRQRHISETEPSSSVDKEIPDHAATLLDQLNSLRDDPNSADTVLVAEGKEFSCHRAIMSASSQYFRLMFSGRLRESHERRIPLNDVTALALGRIVDFVYSGKIKVHFGNIIQFCLRACHKAANN